MQSWEERKKRIKQGIIEGLQLDKMPEISGNFNEIIQNKREMDGYTVENIAIESFPGFYITGNLYRPMQTKDKYPAILSPHGHWKNPDNYGQFRSNMQKRCATFARMGAKLFAYDMVVYGESTEVDNEIPIALLLQTWNSERVLEYLLSRSDVDSNRIGVTGAFEVRQAGFKIHVIARSCETEVARNAIRTVGQAVGVGHMKEHAMVCSDYAIKTIQLAFSNAKERITEERKWQLKTLKEIKAST